LCPFSLAVAIREPTSEVEFTLRAAFQNPPPPSENPRKCFGYLKISMEKRVLLVLLAFALFALGVFIHGIAR
jgi:hypothetical protein